MLKSSMTEKSNPERLAFTASPLRCHRKRIVIESPQNHNSKEWKAYSSLRPHTTPLINRPMQQTLSSTGQSTNFVHLRSISVVESQLKNRYREDMNPYLRKKFRSIVEKKQQSFALEKSYDHTIETNELQISTKSSVRRPLQKFYLAINGEERLQIQKGVDEAYLLTAKERIVRLIEMKKERETQFKTLNHKIKAQRASIQQSRGKNRLEQFKKHTIEQQEWDKKWREDVSRESKRYRNRLIVKCNKQTNPFFTLVN